MNNEDNIEEVPLDLFSQVTLEDSDDVEVLDFETKQEQVEPSKNVITIPADAYMKYASGEKE